jgi:hypothetical protein
MKIVILTLVLSIGAFASERSNRWNGFQNPNKIEKKQNSHNSLKDQKAKRGSNKVELRSSRNLKSRLTAM